MSILAVILSPIVWLMEILLEFFISITESEGLSILLLSSVFALALLPVRRIAARAEDTVGVRMKAAGEEVAIVRQTVKGEKLFLETEKIYTKHNYHPIHSVVLGASFLVMLPVLLSAIVLFSQTDLITGKSFLLVEDLQLPDSILGTINLLPIIMSALTVIDANFRFGDDKAAKYKFYALASVLLILVYNLPAGLVLYWIGSNAFSFLLSLQLKKNQGTS